jgi:hypothetical protein
MLKPALGVRRITDGFRRLKLPQPALLFFRNEKSLLTLPQGKTRDGRHDSRSGRATATGYGSPIGLLRHMRPIMITLPVDRALAIYSTIANRSETKNVRERLSRHLWQVFADGEHDPHRLTVHGLSYLQNLDRKRDS